MDPRHGPQTGKSGYPGSQNADRHEGDDSVVREDEGKNMVFFDGLTGHEDNSGHFSRGQS